MTIGEWWIYDLDNEDAMAILDLRGIVSLTNLINPNETGERKDRRWRVQSEDLPESQIEILNRFITGLAGSDVNFFLEGPTFTRDETGIISGS